MKSNFLSVGEGPKSADVNVCLRLLISIKIDTDNFDQLHSLASTYIHLLVITFHSYSHDIITKEFKTK